MHIESVQLFASYSFKYFNKVNCSVKKRAFKIINLFKKNRSRKLNSQLERAIQEAMAELDRASTSVTTTSTTSIASSTPITSRTNKMRQTKPTSSTTQPRAKPVRIAPAPPTANTYQQQQKCLRNNK